MFTLGGIIAFLTGLAGPLSSIIGKIEDRKIALAKAETDQEKNKINAEIEEAHDRRAAIVAEATNRLAGALNALMRAYIAIGPASYIFKYYFWDHVVGSYMGCAGPAAMVRGVPVRGCETFVSDGLSVQMAAVMTAVVAFYLVYDITARFRK